MERRIYMSNKELDGFQILKDLTEKKIKTSKAANFLGLSTSGLSRLNLWI